MLRTVLVVAALLMISACRPCPPCPECPACPVAEVNDESDSEPDQWFVVHVTDGDTLVARLEGARIERKETIRLLNIDTPEKNEPGFVEATEALKSLVRMGHVQLEFEKVDVEKRDGFGRLLAYVIADGKNVNLEMVKLGWSKLYTKYGKGRLAEEFEAAEREARENKRGLWGMN